MKKDYYTNKVKAIAEDIYGELFRNDGAYIVSRDGNVVINIYDYIAEYEYEEKYGDLRHFVNILINECLEEQ